MKVIESNYNANLVITGTPDENFDVVIKEYFERYNPAGYGTRIDRDYVVDGKRTVVVTRWNSCD
jgi:hypothetical protein